MKKHLLSLFLLAAFALVGSAGAFPASAQSADFRWSGTLTQGQTVAIRGVNGSITARPSSDGTVRVEAVRSARRSDPESVRIEVVPHADGVTICSVYPTPGGAERENACLPGGGQNNVNNNDVRVHFTVHVPAGVQLAASNVNGDIEAHDLRSYVRVSTVNGDVSVRTTGAARATTVNGNVTARMGASQVQEGARFSTVNGNVTLEMPAGLNAELRASTLNGSIDSDYPITVQGRLNRRTLRGTIGSGGPELRVSTINGRIRLRQH
jgi:hypothetical protein